MQIFLYIQFVHRLFTYPSNLTCSSCYFTILLVSIWQPFATARAPPRLVDTLFSQTRCKHDKKLWGSPLIFACATLLESFVFAFHLLLIKKKNFFPSCSCCTSYHGSLFSDVAKLSYFDV